MANEWASAEATAIITANGSNRPPGILNSTPSSPSSPLSAQLKIDSLIDLVSDVKERYLQDADGVAFVMHRLTAANRRKLK